ncbi:MAG: hypothetical protein MJ219_00150 [Mycoplasmoidaceae bacterium]|nr:hypothetical protein [Mycoplasmoidaceae bacterium]
MFYNPKAYSVEISGDDYSTEDIMAVNYKSTFTATVTGQQGVSQVVT